MRRVLPAALLALTVTAPAAAQTQARMNATADTAYTRADAAMSREWTQAQGVMKRRDARDTSRGGGFGYAAALLESQRAWLRFRDAQCVVEGGEYAGGSLQSMTMTTCRTRLTNERRVQLRTLTRQK